MNAKKAAGVPELTSKKLHLTGFVERACATPETRGLNCADHCDGGAGNFGPRPVAGCCLAPVYESGVKYAGNNFFLKHGDSRDKSVTKAPKQ
jgi:hypothetical protein